MSGYLAGARARTLPCAADPASLRALESQLLVDGMLTQLVSAITSGTAPKHFSWSSGSTATDDGVNAIKPNDVGGAGRWVAELVHNADVADATLLFAKLNQNGATTGQLIGWNGTVWAPTTPTAAVPVARSLTGAGLIAVAGDHLPHDLSVDRTISIDAGGTANRLMLTTDGANATWGLLVDAQVSPTAAIAVTKFAHGTANQFLTTAGDGVTVQWATLSIMGFVPTTRTVQGTAPIQVNGVNTAVTLASDLVVSVLSATVGALGVVQLAGDLGGTAAAPSTLRLRGTTIGTAGGALAAGLVLATTAGAAADWTSLASLLPKSALQFFSVANLAALTAQPTAGFLGGEWCIVRTTSAVYEFRLADGATPNGSTIVGGVGGNWYLVVSGSA